MHQSMSICAEPPFLLAPPLYLPPLSFKPPKVFKEACLRDLSERSERRCCHAICRSSTILRGVSCVFRFPARPQYANLVSSHLWRCCGLVQWRGGSWRSWYALAHRAAPHIRTREQAAVRAERQRKYVQAEYRRQEVINQIKSK